MNPMVGRVTQALNDAMITQPVIAKYKNGYDGKPSAVYPSDLARLAITELRDIDDTTLIMGLVDRFSDGKPMTIERWKENWASLIDEILK